MIIQRIIFLLILFLLGISCLFSQNEYEKKLKEDILKSEKEYSTRTDEEKKLQYGVYDLVKIAEAADTSFNAKKEFRFHLKNNKNWMADKKDRVRVLIWLRSFIDTTNIIGLIRSSDGMIFNVGKRNPIILCSIHPKKIRLLASSSSIISIAPIAKGHTKSVVSAGDSQLEVDSVRQQFSVYGDSVNIGVISDGVHNIQDVENNSELPNVTILSVDDSTWDDGNHKWGCYNEGTAMLEIVHDLAPHANLFFSSGLNGYASMAIGITALKNKGCKIIVDDIKYLVIR